MRGTPWALTEGEDGDLREFLTAIAPRRPAGAVAWAMSRFEMGCGRRREAEALSDYLLALRALLERGTDTATSNLALRVAVLCAEEGERRRVQRRIELAQALERFLMGDAPNDDYVEAIGSDSPRTLVDEVERHLRALLRDVLCGYLDPDLRAVSDDLLLEQPRPIVPPEPAGEPVTAFAVEREHQHDVEPEREPRFERDQVPEVEPRVQTGQMQYDWDDDPAGYSAPV